MKRYIRSVVEVLLITSLLGGLNLFLGKDPGFISLYFAPYIALNLFVSSFYGMAYGFISLGISLLWILVPGLNGFITLELPYLIPLLSALAGIYIFGLIHSQQKNTILKLKKRIKELSKENWRFRELSKAQAEVNRELEERVSRHWESITNLYSLVDTLNTRNMEKSLHNLLETAKIFTKLNKASIWKPDPDNQSYLIPLATLGWTEEDRFPERLPVESSLEGWVFRNRSLFSLRMLLESEGFGKYDSSRNIITLPIILGKYIWGVLNIEDIPFQKYNLYTEQILSIIINLAQPALENALEYEQYLIEEERDETTGLPNFGQLYRLMQEELNTKRRRKGFISLMVLEVLNLDTLKATYGSSVLATVFSQILFFLENLSSARGKPFRYRGENQLALLFTDLDSDGASLFCLEVLSKAADNSWKIQDNDVPLELALGFSVARESTENPEELMTEAEHLLDVQKV